MTTTHLEMLADTFAINVANTKILDYMRVVTLREMSMGWYKAKSIEDVQKSYFDARGYPENEILSTQEDFEKNYIWWLGHFADRLQGRHGISLDNLFAVINGADPDTKEVLGDFLFGCFKGGDEAADCADRIIAESADRIRKGHPTGEPMILSPAGKRPSISVDGQVREKGIGNV